MELKELEEQQKQLGEGEGKEELVLENEVMKVWGKVWERSEQEPEGRRKIREKGDSIYFKLFKHLKKLHIFTIWQHMQFIMKCWNVFCGAGRTVS